MKKSYPKNEAGDSFQEWFLRDLTIYGHVCQFIFPMIQIPWIYAPHRQLVFHTCILRYVNYNQSPHVSVPNCQLNLNPGKPLCIESAWKLSLAHGFECLTSNGQKARIRNIHSSEITSLMTIGHCTLAKLPKSTIELQIAKRVLHFWLLSNLLNLNFDIWNSDTFVWNF